MVHEAPPPPWYITARKFLVAILGFAAQAVATGLLSGRALVIVSTVLAVAGALGVYAVPNVRPAG